MITPVLDFIPDKEELIVKCAEYHRSSIKPRGFQEFIDMYDGPHKCWWELKNSDKLTGKVNQRIWVPNVITDNGGISMLKNTFNNAGSAVSIFNHVVISPNGCSTKLTATTGTSPITTLSVQALLAPISNGATMTLGFNGTNPTTVTINNSGGYAIGATSLTVNSFTPPINFPVGTDLVANPSVTDNPSSVSGTVDSGALSSGNFTFNATTGTGNRNVVIVVTFNGTTGNAGTYSEAYTSNAGTIASNSTASHAIFPGFVLNSGSNEQLTLTEKA